MRTTALTVDMSSCLVPPPAGGGELGAGGGCCPLSRSARDMASVDRWIDRLMNQPIPTPLYIRNMFEVLQRCSTEHHTHMTGTRGCRRIGVSKFWHPTNDERFDPESERTRLEVHVYLNPTSPGYNNTAYNIPVSGIDR